MGRVGLVQTRRMLRAAVTTEGLYSGDAFVGARGPSSADDPMVKTAGDVLREGIGGQQRVMLEASTSTTSPRLIALRGEWRPPCWKNCRLRRLTPATNDSIDNKEK